MSTVKDFEELVIYQKARKLAKQVYDITREGHFQFDSRFIQQIRAAAGSVSDNIAEGFERQGNKEFINFLYIAKGSCGEVRSQLIRAFDVGHISEQTFSQMYNDCRTLSLGILNMIKSLKSSDMKGTKYQPTSTPTQTPHQTRSNPNQTPHQTPIELPSPPSNPIKPTQTPSNPFEPQSNPTRTPPRTPIKLPLEPHK